MTALERNRRFSIFFAHSALAVTPSEKSSINTNRKSTTRFPMSPRWTSYVVPNPQMVAQKRKVSKIWTMNCDNFKTVAYDIGYQLLFITNRKSHTGFRLIPTSMTLNDLERRNSPYFAFFSSNSIALLANYVSMVEVRPIMSVKYRLPVSVSHFWPQLTHPAVRSLCDIWAILVILTLLLLIHGGISNHGVFVLYFVDHGLWRYSGVTRGRTAHVTPSREGDTRREKCYGQIYKE